eukprot:6196923-Pleurochrysis_carterae.AAC.4
MRRGQPERGRVTGRKCKKDALLVLEIRGTRSRQPQSMHCGTISQRYLCTPRYWLSSGRFEGVLGK